MRGLADYIWGCLCGPKRTEKRRRNPPFHIFKNNVLVCIMAQTTLSVRMDDSLKSDFDKVCNELGLSMTTAITMLAKKMTREKRLPFEVSVDPFYSEENLARLRRSIAQMESTGGTVHEVNLDD